MAFISLRDQGFYDAGNSLKGTADDAYKALVLRPIAVRQANAEADQAESQVGQTQANTANILEEARLKRGTFADNLRRIKAGADSAESTADLGALDVNKRSQIDPLDIQKAKALTPLEIQRAQALTPIEISNAQLGNARTKRDYSIETNMLQQLGIPLPEDVTKTGSPLSQPSIGTLGAPLSQPNMGTLGAPQGTAAPQSADVAQPKTPESDTATLEDLVSQRAKWEAVAKYSPAAGMRVKALDVKIEKFKADRDKAKDIDTEQRKLKDTAFLDEVKEFNKKRVNYDDALTKLQTIEAINERGETGWENRFIPTALSGNTEREFEAAAIGYAKSLRKPGEGSQSDTDVELLRQSAPQVGNSKELNKNIIANERRGILNAKAKQDYISNRIKAGISPSQATQEFDSKSAETENQQAQQGDAVSAKANKHTSLAKEALANPNSTPEEIAMANEMLKAYGGQ